MKRIQKVPDFFPSRVVLALVLIVVCRHAAIGQSLNQLRLGYRQDFNNYIWQSHFSYHTPLYQKQRFLLQQNYEGNLLETAAAAENWKDNHQLLATYLYRLHPNWSAIGRLESSTFADKQSGYQNSYQTHAFSVGIGTNPATPLQFRSLIGLKADERFGRMNRGFHFQVQAEAEKFEIAGYQNRLTGFYETEQFQGRNNFDLVTGYQVSREFENDTRDSLTYRFGLSRTAYFISAAGDLEERLEQLHQFGNFLTYPLSDRLRFNLATTFLLRASSVDQTINENPTGTRKRNDSQFAMEAGLTWAYKKFLAQMNWLTQNQSQEFQISRSIHQTPYIGSIGIPDNDSKENALRGLLSWQLGKADSLNFSFLLSRYQYDTPDSNNFDDRDEFRSSMTLTYHRRLNRNLDMGVEAKGNLLHLVYLFKQKSANNNWNRIAQLRIYQHFHDGPFRFYQSGEVLANYTSYDFEVLQDQIRSYVYRKYSLTDSIRIGSREGLQLILFHRLELEENGRLFWERFAQQRLVNRRNHYFSAGVQFKAFDLFRVYQGISGYLRKEWRFKPIPGGELRREHWGDFLSIGPLLRVFLINSGRKNAFLSFSRFRVTTPAGAKYFINQVDLNSHWYF